MGRLLKNILKIAGALIVLLFLFYGYLYLRYNGDLPSGTAGPEADALAQKMLNALNNEAYQETHYLEWTYRRNQYKWYKIDGKCDVVWKDFKVQLNFDNPDLSKAYIHNFEVHNEQAEELIDKALNSFYNDSFWLVAPFKVFDQGTERRLVKTDKGDALLVTFTKGGATPGDSYLWLLDESGKPLAFRFWTSIVSIKGLEASWDDWVTTDSGVLLPGSHKILFLNLSMGDVKATK